MTPERWRQVENLYYAALELQPEARPSFLDYRLRSAGVLAGESTGTAQPRCQLYARYLRRHLS
jgi:hypothetical protein